MNDRGAPLTETTGKNVTSSTLNVNLVEFSCSERRLTMCSYPPWVWRLLVTCAFTVCVARSAEAALTQASVTRLVDIHNTLRRRFVLSPPQCTPLNRVHWHEGLVRVAEVRARRCEWQPASQHRQVSDLCFLPNLPPARGLIASTNVICR